MDEQKTMPERVKTEMVGLVKQFIDSTIGLNSDVTNFTAVAQTLQDARKETIKAQADAALAIMKATEAEQKLEAAASAMLTSKLQVELAVAVTTEARDGIVVKMTKFLAETGVSEGASEEFIKSAMSSRSLDWLTWYFKGW